MQRSELADLHYITPIANLSWMLQRGILSHEPIIERVVDLFLRIHTRQAEVAATVHFAAHRLVATDTEPVAAERSAAAAPAG